MKMSFIFSGSLEFDALVITGMQSVYCPLLDCILHHVTGTWLSDPSIFVVEPNVLMGYYSTQINPVLA